MRYANHERIEINDNAAERSNRDAAIERKSVSNRAIRFAQPVDPCQDTVLGAQRCGSSPSMRLLGCVGSHSSTSRR
jgi:hypothetical protein